MPVVSIIYVLLCAAAALTMSGCALAMSLSRRVRRRRERRYSRPFIRLVAARMLHGDTSPMARFPMCSSRGARAVLARLLAAASASTCFEEPAAVRRMMTANGIESWLLRRVKHSRGYVRAHYLALLASLPVSRATADCICRCTARDNRCAMFRAMLVAVAADPSAAVRLVGRFPYPLTHLEMAELTSMLRRGMLPLAYEPLLASPHRNLLMLGLNIVRTFGIAESEHLLDGIIAGRDASPAGAEVRREALEVVVALHLSVLRPPVASYIRSMKAPQRRSLMRRMAAEGYSAETLLGLARSSERPYAESLAASYKRSLAWHSPTSHI